MPGWLCKIWRILANVIEKVVDLVASVVKTFADLVVDVLGAASDAIFGSPLGLIAGAALVWFLFFREDEPKQETEYYPFEPAVPDLNGGKQ